MQKAYSDDLRVRIVRAMDAGAPLWPQPARAVAGHVSALRSLEN
jgi:hypothetical protein